MLIDGGFSRKACFWDFTRHLDRLDAILITRLSDENTQGISAVLERKSVGPVYPQIGHFFANILETKKDKEKEKHEKEEKEKQEKEDKLKKETAARKEREEKERQEKDKKEEKEKR